MCALIPYCDESRFETQDSASVRGAPGIDRERKEVSVVFDHLPSSTGTTNDDLFCRSGSAEPFGASRSKQSSFRQRVVEELTLKLKRKRNLELNLKHKPTRTLYFKASLVALAVMCWSRWTCRRLFTAGLFLLLQGPREICSYGEGDAFYDASFLRTSPKLTDNEQSRESMSFSPSCLSESFSRGNGACGRWSKKYMSSNSPVNWYSFSATFKNS